jgi:ATP-dependent RNA helicase DDX47/RRP3
MDFGPDIDAILKAIPKERTTYLFSATMTTKVAKLQRASLTNPVRVEVSTKYVCCTRHLLQLILATQVFHGVHLTAVLSFHTAVTKGRSPRLSRQFTGSKFYYSLHTDSSRCPAVCLPRLSELCSDTSPTRLSIVLRNLGFAAVPLHGQLSQSQRLGSLSKFQSGSRKILVATDVASRYVTFLCAYAATDRK